MYRMSKQKFLYRIIKMIAHEQTRNIDGINYISLGLSIPIMRERGNSNLVFVSFGERVKISGDINQVKEKLIISLIKKVNKGPHITSRGYYLDPKIIDKHCGGWTKYEKLEPFYIFP